MAITIYTGRPGDGKTYVMTHRAKNALEKGVEVYSNYHLNFEGKNLHYWDSLSDIEEVENGIILMDEAHVYFNSREWANLTNTMQRKLQQHRKEGLHIWGTVQHESRLDVVYRELVSDFKLCRLLIPKIGFFKGLIQVKSYFPEDMQKENKEAFDTEYYRIRPDIYNFYDTLQKIKVEERSKHDVVCKVCGETKTNHIWTEGKTKHEFHETIGR